jgi:regulator of replication initiation timing
MKLEDKIKAMLEQADAGIQEANVDGTKLDGERQDISGADDGKKAAALAKKTKFPGNDKGVEMKQEKQGADDEQIEDDVEDLGSEDDGKNASDKAKYAGGLSAKGGAEGAAPNFKTVVDPSNVVGQANSKGNVDGNKLEALDLSPIFGDAELSEEFKDKATSMFEAVVQARVNHEFEALQEQYETELAEEVAEIKSELVEKVDVFLDSIVEAWIAENELAIESGLRAEIAEDFMTGLKNLFKESYIEVPEEKFDILADLEEQVALLKTQVEDQASALDSISEENDSLKKEKVFAEVSEGLADTEADKFKQLIEGVEYGSEDLFREKLSVIKENYFPKAAKVSAEKALEEQATGNGEFGAPSQVEQYAKAMTRYITK